MPRKWRRARLPLLALAAIAPALFAWPAVRLSRGRPVPLLTVFFATLLPRLLGSLFGTVAGRATDHALASVVGDMAACVAAEGTSEASRPMILGDLVSAACLAVFAMGALGAIATIDVRHLALETTRRDRWLSRATAVVGATCIVAALALFAAFANTRALTNVAVVVPLLVAAFALVAALAAQAAPALRQSR